MMTKYSPEVKEWAVRMVLEHQDEQGSQWAAIRSIPVKIGCTAETPRRWVGQTETDRRVREGVTTSERERIKALQRRHFIGNTVSPPWQRGLQQRACGITGAVHALSRVESAPIQSQKLMARASMTLDS